jgi:hypothetical protein
LLVQLDLNRFIPFAVKYRMRPLSRVPREPFVPLSASLRRKPFIPRLFQYSLHSATVACLVIFAVVGLAQDAADASGSGQDLTAVLGAPQPGGLVGSNGPSPELVGDSSVTASTSLPDAPGQEPTPAQETLKNPVPTRQPQTKRILGIIPNFRSVSTDEQLAPQSVREKFLTATDDSFDYSSAFVPAMLAAYSMGINSTPEFGEGAVGYARYFWHTAVDQTSENYLVEFVMPVATHEDTRYYTLGRGGFVKRTGYALSRAVVTRTDSGHETFNFSEVVGSGAASGLSSLYYPTRERSLGNTGTEWGLDIGIDAASFVAKEFWPDINRHLFHQKTSIDSSSR